MYSLKITSRLVGEGGRGQGGEAGRQGGREGGREGGEGRGGRETSETTHPPLGVITLSIDKNDISFTECQFVFVVSLTIVQSLDSTGMRWGTLQEN